MGGVVSGIGDFVGDVVGGVGGIASGVAGAIPGIGPYVGPIVGGITGGPLGFATSLGSNALQGNYGGGGGGGGGSSTPMYAQPGFNYGNQTYQNSNKPVDASNYFITGDRGVYNLLPALGQINAGKESSLYSPNRIDNPRQTERFNAMGAANAYTPYEAYQDIQAQMANDPTALAAFNKAYGPITRDLSNIKLPGGAKLPGGIKLPSFQPPNPASPLGQFNSANPNPYNQYVNFGLNKLVPNQSTQNTDPNVFYSNLASYAAENKNPFFLPFETTTGATPLGFTPSQNALAAIDSSTYLSGYQNAAQQQQKYLRDQKQAQQANIPAPVRPTTPAPVRPTTPTPVRPTTPAPVRPTTPPSYPGIITTPARMAQGGIAMLRRK